MKLIKNALVFGLFMMTMSSIGAWSNFPQHQTYSLNGRTFFPFNLLNGGPFHKLTRFNSVESSIQSLTSSDSKQSAQILSLETRFQQALATFQSHIEDFTSQITYFTSQIAILKMTQDDLELKIEALGENQLECPTTATNGQVVGTKCYTVNAGPLDLIGARTACGDQGGILAEPPVSSTEALGSFVTSLYTVFGNNFGLSQNPMIGVTETAEADVFQYDSSGLLVSNNLLTATSTTAEVAAINRNTGNSLNVVSVDSRRSFICQFELV